MEGLTPPQRGPMGMGRVPSTQLGALSAGHPQPAIVRPHWLILKCFPYVFTLKRHAPHPGVDQAPPLHGLYAWLYH